MWGVSCGWAMCEVGHVGACLVGVEPCGGEAGDSCVVYVQGRSRERSETRLTQRWQNGGKKAKQRLCLA